MSQINVNGLVNNISEKTNVYTPIIEAIVNSLQSIEESKIEEGLIRIVLSRENQTALGLDGDTLPRIQNIEIHDNGHGFSKENRDSFDTLYSPQKVLSGGKGFGRFMFLKYFEKVDVDSIFQEGSKVYKRKFSFSNKNVPVDSLIEDESVDEVNSQEKRTIVYLNNLQEPHTSRLDKKLETISRNLVEKLLPYFINEKYKCPKIILEEIGTDESIVLNDFFNEHDGIKKVHEEKFTLKRDSLSEEFEVKIFKIYYTKSTSTVTLTAHNRAVTFVPLYDFIPEFKDDFYEIREGEDGNSSNKNYSIKAYVLGDYLNKNVSLDREDFKFSKDAPLLNEFSKKDIELKVIDIVENTFKEEVISRREKKKDRVKKYIDERAPWHKSYFADLDLTNIPYQFDDSTIEGELQKLKFNKEQTVKAKVAKILEGEQEEIAKKIDDVAQELTEFGKSDLAHYVVLRKVVLDLLEKSLTWNVSKKYEREKIIHNVIFPMNNDSDHLSYDAHNLWILDERLSFTEYISSDKALNTGDERPDLLIFNGPIVVREDNDPSNPITIFEFKRPQREDYSDDEDPINQMLKYVEKIRKGDFKDIDGRFIKAGENTPAYAYLVCDLTSKIKEFCKKYSLTPSPDGEGYFGYQSGYKVYIEVISFDKLVKDAELRNKVFFKRLKIL